MITMIMDWAMLSSLSDEQMEFFSDHFTQSMTGRLCSPESTVRVQMLPVVRPEHTNGTN